MALLSRPPCVRTRTRSDGPGIQCWTVLIQFNEFSGLGFKPGPHIRFFLQDLSFLPLHLFGHVRFSLSFPVETLISPASFFYASTCTSAKRGGECKKRWQKNMHNSMCVSGTRLSMDGRGIGKRMYSNQFDVIVPTKHEAGSPLSTFSPGRTFFFSHHSGRVGTKGGWLPKVHTQDIHYHLYLPVYLPTGGIPIPPRRFFWGGGVP